MPNQIISSVENNFTKGLITESTGLNFPENAATDTDNCDYTIVGDVLRREGIDFEDNFQLTAIDRTNIAINTYKWNNAGGDGTTQIVVVGTGVTVFFYRSSSATQAVPLSARRLAGFVNLASFLAAGATLDSTAEMTFADGNGYLFIFHPSCDPIYCTYDSGVVTGNRITVQIRDFLGIDFNEGVTSNRPVSLSAEHQYNLQNQGWSAGPSWVGNYSSTWTIAVNPSVSFTVPAGLVGVVPGVSVNIVSLTGSFGFPIPPGTIVASGSVVSYAATTMVVNVTAVGAYAGGTSTSGWVAPIEVGLINTFKSVSGFYPSNADVWWYFKNASGTFDPATTVAKVTYGSGRAPQGHFLLDAFNQRRDIVSGIPNLTGIVTTKRPTVGTWFQGRVWYTGLNASQAVTGDAPFYTWTENIYFSQIVNSVNDFGKCYQENDPTSENLFDLLPTDGGVIVIQGSGPIYQLFPTQNGLLVFAGNGVWFITGSQGIGFTANDYTITKISNITSISSTSFVNVTGMPFFWNEEGIYQVQPTQGGGLEVNPITVGTILSFYNNIPTSSKRYAHGAYDPINYVIQWVYTDTEAATVDGRYNFNKILNYNTFNKAFFPYTIDSTTTHLVGIVYVSTIGGLSSVPSGFKYLSSFPDQVISQFTFADEHDTAYVDWGSSSSPKNYVSFFTTGYKIHGQGQRRFQVPYIYTYSRGDVPTSFYIQSIWDYAIDRNSNRWSSLQQVNNFNPRYGMIFRRHRLRGMGIVLQFKITSVDGQPFDLMGWSTFETQNQGV